MSYSCNTWFFTNFCKILGIFVSVLSAQERQKILVTRDFSSCSSVTDTLDDLLAESGDEEEEEAIMNQVLDEIGVEISGKVSVSARVREHFRGLLYKYFGKTASPGKNY